MTLCRNKCINRSFLVCLVLAVFVLFLTFVVTPLVFRWSPSLMRGFILVPEQEIPENVDYKHPENFGFVGGRNIYLPTTGDATLGVWHTLPSDLEEEVLDLKKTDMNKTAVSQLYNDWLANATVFLYLHGSAGTRTSPHRLRLYHLLNQLNYHLVTFDYRGYGDSTSSPKGESDLIEDTMTVFGWIQERVTTGNIFIWGHSLGTGVAAHVASNLEGREVKVKGIVLEAPFNNMASAVMVNSLAKAVSFLPWFHYCFIQPLYINDMSFESDRHLRNTTMPVLILHAKDDQIIPYELANELYESTVSSRKDPTSVRIIGYDKSLHYGHYNITLDPNLNNTIRQFVGSPVH